MGPFTYKKSGKSPRNVHFPLEPFIMTALTDRAVAHPGKRIIARASHFPEYETPEASLVAR